MRILMLSWEYPPHIVGGLGRHVTDLTAALSQLGIDVHVVTPQLNQGDRYEVTAMGVTVHRVAAPPLADQTFVGFVQEMNRGLAAAALDARRRSGDFDVIHAHDWLVAQAAIMLKQAWHRPLITTIHATERGRQQGHVAGDHSAQIDRLERLLTGEAWRVITCSRYMAQEVQSYFGTAGEKIDVVPNGVVVRGCPFESDRERREFRRRFAADDQPLVFYVGRIVYEKGLHILLDAWPRVLLHMPQARLIIAGAGAYLDALRQRAWDLGIIERVFFPGYVSDEERDRLYHVTDAAVFPSLYEPFGIVALEAMAAGCPVIVAQTGGLGEVVSLHETGLTIYPNNVESLVWGILHTLAHPRWSQERATNALREVRERYSWHTIARTTAEIYRRACVEWQV
ncbi:MAG: glycosyltransferase family 4 protein [Chloroflexi bacterium]|nr:glycosyltransferase family 4 protein [Chloroflexota bacterium]